MDELILDFLTETKENLDSLDTKLVTLEQNPNDDELLGSIFRTMHTIKGTCGFLNLPRLEAVAHAGENIMDKIRSKELLATAKEISLILESLDKIKELVSYLEANGTEAEGNDIELITKLNNAATNSQNQDKESPASVNDQETQTSEDINNSVPQVEVNEQVSIEAQENSLTSSSQIQETQKKLAVEKGLEVANRAETNKTEQQTVRVNIGVLDHLMQVVGELVLNRNQLVQIDRIVKDSKFTGSIQRLSYITSELQEGIMKARMQPIESAWSKFPRMIRDLGKELNKKLQLEMYGKETELDRQLIEMIKDPLTHMVRNSADHGIELPEERLASGKRDVGTITLNAYHQGSHIIIEISDDGKGLNIEKIKNKIIQNRLATAEEINLMNEQDIITYVFKPGFSTSETVTAISGRGVGMDVVKTNIEKIGGTVDLKTNPGKGSMFIIKIPLTLAIISVLIVECGGEKFGIPQVNVVEMCKAGEDSGYRVEEINQKKVVRMRNALLPTIILSDVLQVGARNSANKKSSDNSDHYIVVCDINGVNFGIIVDKIHDTEEIVVKSVAPVIKSIGIFSGNTILGNGKVIMIIDPVGLLKFVGDVGEESDSHSSMHHLEQQNLGNRTSLLIISDSQDNLYVVPLEIVSRLEEVKISSIEYSNNSRVIQYRGSLMYLTEIDKNFTYPKDGCVSVAVFHRNQKYLGIVVKKIVDIVEHNLGDDASFTDSNYKTMVVNGKTMDVLQIGDIFFNHIQLEEKHTAPISKKSSKNVLFIDDSPFFRKFIPPVMINEGINVSSIESAEQAISLLESGNIFDLIITDINMPGMSGIEFAEYCKNSNRFNQIPLIALSSSSDDKLISQIKNYGIIDCIAKTNHEALLNIVIRTIQ